MAGAKRSRDQRARDLTEIWELRKIGWNISQLARKFNLSRQQILYDLKTLRKQAEAERAETIEQDRDMAREREWQIRKLAWERFELSCWRTAACRTCTEDTQQDCKVCRGTGAVQVEVPGDPRFLSIINYCDRAIRTLDGLDMPSRHQIDSVNTNIDIFKIMQEQVRASNLDKGYSTGDRIERELERRIAALDQPNNTEDKSKVLPIGLKEMIRETNGEQSHTDP